MRHYLLKHLYESETWKLWGRRHCSKLSLSRTIIKFESHWSVLKRLYFLPYNRPLLDLFVHILATLVMTKYQHDYTAMYSRRKNDIGESLLLSWGKSVPNLTSVVSIKLTITISFVHVQPGSVVSGSYSTISSTTNNVQNIIRFL